jgi:alpha-1,6-mannosyltransferase
MSGAAIVLFAGVVLSPAGHYWYFLWCVPLLACLPLRPPAYAALVTGIVTLGLTAPADPALHEKWLTEWSAVFVVALPVIAGLVVRAAHPAGPRCDETSSVAPPSRRRGPVSGSGSC